MTDKCSFILGRKMFVWQQVCVPEARWECGHNGGRVGGWGSPKQGAFRIQSFGYSITFMGHYSRHLPTPWGGAAMWSILDCFP